MRIAELRLQRLEAAAQAGLAGRGAVRCPHPLALALARGPGLHRRLAAHLPFMPRGRGRRLQVAVVE
eukprot:3872808-Lingulodinium_polyedra.AAC.1